MLLSQVTPDLMLHLGQFIPLLCNTDQNAVPTVNQLKAEKELSGPVELRQNKYLNNIVEQDQRVEFIAEILGVAA